MMKTPNILAAAICLMLVASAARADDKPAPFQVFPPDINLQSAAATQSIIIQATRPDGITQDVTGESKFELVDTKLAAIDGNVVRPTADGNTQLKVTWHDQSVSIPVKVKDAACSEADQFSARRHADFHAVRVQRRRLPWCCRGKDGFHLTLFGYDAAQDYNSLTRQITSRRINLALPEESLVLTKATGVVPHTGGEQFKPGTPRYNTILSWLKAGAAG